MSELSTGKLAVDIQPFLDQLGLGEKAANQLAQAAQAAGDATTKSFSAAAASAVEYSNRVAAQVAEVRNAQAATRSAADEVRRLADANRDLAAAQQGLGKTSAEYTRIKGLIAENTAKIKEAKQAILENKQATEQERAAVQAVRDARLQETNQTKLVAAAARDAAAAAKLEAQAQKEAGAATLAAGSSGGFLSGVLGKVGAAFAGLFAVNKLKEIGQDIIETTSEFQRLEAVLTTINGGDEGKGKLEFANLRAFTLRNPFEIKAVTEGYVQLRNRGINPTITQLQSLADLAAASGKSFEQVTEGLLGATTGRFVRLKEFGVTAKQQGDTVAFTFRGVTTVVQKSQEAIADYVLGLGQLNGVAGATGRILNTTGGRITNLKDSFTELFATIGEGTSGPLNSFIKRLTDAATAIKLTLQSSEEKAKNRSAGGVTEFQEALTKQFQSIASNAKASGQSVTEALKSSLDDQLKILDAKERLAKQRLKEFQRSTRGKAEGFGDQLAEVADPLGTIRTTFAFAAGGMKASTREELQAQVELYRGKKKAALEASKAAVAGSQQEAEQLGLIEALQAKIKQEEEQRARSSSRKEIHALNLLIIADQKAIDDLLEKQLKTRQKQALSYESQLRALLQERATLTQLAAKAAADSADDAAGKAKVVFDEALRQVDVVQAKLVQRELDLRKQALKAGGASAVGRLGSLADGVVDGTQAEQLTMLRLAAMDKYYTDLYKIMAEREQRLFDLRVDSDEKEIEAIDRKFDKLIKANTDGIERQAIEEQRQREQTALRAVQEQKRIDQTAALARNTASAVGQVYGPGTGVSVFEAKRAEAQTLLNIEKKAAEDSLNNTLNKTGKEAEIEREALRAQLARIANQQKALTAEQKRSEFNLYKLVLGDKDTPELRAAFEEVGAAAAKAFSDIVSAQEQAAAAQAGNATTRIGELQSQLAAEIQLNKDGAASNIKGIQDQIAEEEAIRREALEEQRRAAKEKVIIDTLTQASSLATAVADILAATAPLNAVPGLGLAIGLGLSAALIGAFAASKVSAFSAAGKIGQGFFKGGYTGGESATEERGVVHGKEFVHTADKTEQYRDLFEALHQDRPQDIDWANPKLAALLPDHSLPGKLREERQASVEHHYRLSMEPLQAKFDGLQSELSEIKGHTERTANRWNFSTLPDGSLLLHDPDTNSTHHIKR